MALTTRRRCISESENLVCPGGTCQISRTRAWENERPTAVNAQPPYTPPESLEHDACAQGRARNVGGDTRRRAERAPGGRLPDRLTTPCDELHLINTQCMRGREPRRRRCEGVYYKHAMSFTPTRAITADTYITALWKRTFLSFLWNIHHRSIYGSTNSKVDWTWSAEGQGRAFIELRRGWNT